MEFSFVGINSWAIFSACFLLHSQEIPAHFFSVYLRIFSRVFSAYFLSVKMLKVLLVKNRKKVVITLYLSMIYAIFFSKYLRVFPKAFSLVFLLIFSRFFCRFFAVFFHVELGNIERLKLVRFTAIIL